MACREATMLSIGGRAFLVRPVTLGQVERIESALNRPAKPVRTAFDVVATALSRDHADVALDDLDGDPGELIRAARSIVDDIGYRSEPAASGEAALGEAMAAAGSALRSGATCAGASSPPPA